MVEMAAKAGETDTQSNLFASELTGPALARAVFTGLTDIWIVGSKTLLRYSHLQFHCVDPRFTDICNIAQ
jgi:hypothetical protein